MWQKLLNIFLILTALIILGVTLFNAYKHRPVEENEPTSEVEVGVVDGEEDKSNEELHTRVGNASPSGRDIAPEEIEAYIQEVFGEFADWGLGVAFCESSFNPDAESDNGLYFGLFQFSHSTFNRNCEGSIWNWKDQVVCAKELYEKGETGRWPNCP